ncbi:MAG TPA: hypothetical protein VFT22_26480, partial [Kofleriaceae bacterium]|nr:hypothetical protein [Kofleriaceae bacterium]
MAVAHRLLSAGACDARAPFVRTTARPGGAIRASDRAESEAEGKLKGRIEGTAEAVVAVLAARGLVLDRGERDRILGERDPARLARWLAG